MKGKILTITDFAARIGVHHSTVWRWMNLKKYSRYLKMYDAEVVEFAGKKFVKIKEVMSETKYHIVSLKHTKNKDPYLTLWRPDAKGYCWPISMAGEYSMRLVIDLLPEGDSSYAVPIGFLGEIVKDYEGRACYKNTEQIRKRIISDHVKSKP